jgi:glycerol-3-phosphate dehydrogenase
MAARPIDPMSPLPLSTATGLLTDAKRFLEAEPESVRSTLRRVIEEEAVHCQEDLTLRRTNWATTETDLGLVRARIAQLTNLPAAMPGA